MTFGQNKNELGPEYVPRIKEVTKTQAKDPENSRKWCKTPKTQAGNAILSYEDGN